MTPPPHPSLPFSDPPPYEGRWPRYRREVREALALLLAHAAPHSADLQRSIAVITEWRDQERGVPPEPHANRVRSAAIMLHRDGRLP